MENAWNLERELDSKKNDYDYNQDLDDISEMVSDFLGALPCDVVLKMLSDGEIHISFLHDNQLRDIVKACLYKSPTFEKLLEEEEEDLEFVLDETIDYIISIIIDKDEDIFELESEDPWFDNEDNLIEFEMDDDSIEDMYYGGIAKISSKNVEFYSDKNKFIKSISVGWKDMIRPLVESYDQSILNLQMVLGMDEGELRTKVSDWTSENYFKTLKYILNRSVSKVMNINQSLALIHQVFGSVKDVDMNLLKCIRRDDMTEKMTNDFESLLTDVASMFRDFTIKTASMLSPYADSDIIEDLTLESDDYAEAADSFKELNNGIENTLPGEINTSIGNRLVYLRKET